MGSNQYGESGNEIKGDLSSIYKINFFQKYDLKIKKISCGYCFNIFLTGCLLNFFKF
jgi:hypothetical protein